MGHPTQNRIKENIAQVYGKRECDERTNECESLFHSAPIYSADFDWNQFRTAMREFNAETHRASVEATFKTLVQEWKARRSHSSCVEDISIDMAYQQIIGLGPDAIPLLLAELERNPDHWFWALFAITRQDPVPEEDRGKIKKMAEAWIGWGRQQGHEW